MKQKQFDLINKWCKYNAYVSCVNIIYKKKLKPRSMNDEFMNNWIILELLYPIK